MNIESKIISRNMSLSQNTADWESWNVREISTEVVDFTAERIAANEIQLIPSQPGDLKQKFSDQFIFYSF